MADAVKEPAVLTGNLGSMSPDRAVQMVRQLCVQLGQDADSFHGNIWPGNIRFDWDGKAVLGQPSDEPASQRKADQVEYLAPEFFWDGSGFAASDVYSLALLLYSACCDGVMPFQPKGGTVTEKDRSSALRKRMKGETVLPPTNVSPQLQDVLKKALAFDPEARYISAAEFLTALSDTDEALPPAEDGESEVYASIAAIAAVAAVSDDAEPENDEPAEESSEAETDAPETETVPAVETETPVEEPAEEFAEEDLPAATEDDQAPSEEPASEAEPAEAEDLPVMEESPSPRMIIEEPAPVCETEALPEETPEAAPSGDNERKAKAVKTNYTVQKDFEKKGRNKDVSQVPADSKKTKRSRRSPAIPILCVLAVLIIGAAVYCCFFLGQEPADSAQEPSEVVSEPYIIEITPEPTSAPEEDNEASGELEVSDAELAETEENPSDAEGEEETESNGEGETENDEEPVTGSATIDSYTVAPMSDTVYVDSYGVNLRSGPSTTYDVKKTISRGTALRRTGTVNGWSQVQYEGEEYYISTTLLTTAKPTGTGTSAGTSTGTGTSAGTSTGTGTSSGTGTSTGSGTYSGGSSGSAPVVTAARDIVEVSADDSYLRSGPSTGYTHLYTLNKGAVLQRTGTVSGWSRVVYDGKEVYIHDSLISQKTDTVNACGSLKVSTEANIRKGAGTDKEVLKVASVGSTYEITGMSGTWYRVNVDGGVGYVNRKMVTVSSFTLVTDKTATLEVTSAVNVRKGPGTSYDVLGTEDTGKELTATGYTDNGWYQISYGESGVTAYVSDTLVKEK